MSDWWYPGQLARQDKYGNPLPDEEWPAVQAAPEERAPLQITVRPPSAVKKELPKEFSPADAPEVERPSAFQRMMPKVYDPLQKQQQDVANLAYSFTPPGAISDVVEAYQNKDPMGMLLGVGLGVPGAGTAAKLAAPAVRAAVRHPAATMGGLAAIGTMLGTDQAEAGKLTGFAPSAPAIIKRLPTMGDIAAIKEAAVGYGRKGWPSVDQGVFKTTPEAYAETTQLVPQVSIKDRLPGPLPGEKLPNKGRVQPIIDNADEIAARIAERLEPWRKAGDERLKFYHTGPVIRGLERYGDMSVPEANTFMRNWAGQGAATSPRTQTPPNLRNSSYLLHERASGNPLTPERYAKEGNIPGFPMMGMHVDLADKFARGVENPWINPKPTTFRENWSGNLKDVTGDTHNIRSTLYEMDQIKPGSLPRGWFNSDEAYAKYRSEGFKAIDAGDINDTLGDKTVNGIRRQAEYLPMVEPWYRAAQKLGIHPAEGQSGGWFSYGDITGLQSPPKTITNLLNDQVAATAKAANVSPEKIVEWWAQGKIPLAGVAGAGVIGSLAATDQAEAGKLSAAKAVIGELANPFYSAAGRAVDNAKIGKGTADQWLGYLRNQPGVKPEELNYVFGNLPEGQLTKAQMQAHAAQNEVRLGEVVKGDPKETAFMAPDSPGFDPDRIQRANPTKYSQWQLPGGENYRETLLTLPVGSTGGKPDIKAINALTERIAGLEDELEAVAGRRRAPIEAMIEQLQGERAALGGGRDAENQGARYFKSSHWDEPNVLAHVRTNDREIPGVGKSLHVEEIQSDWHQKGRTQGYASDREALLREVIDKEKAWNVSHQLRRADTDERYAEYNEASKRLMAFDNRGAGVPDAPFKSTWADVALKRQIREASEKGYDAISWTPGEAQAARYDLSKQVDQIRYKKNADGTFDVWASHHDGSSMGDALDKQKLTPPQIADFVGKDVADRIVNDAGRLDHNNPGDRVLSGLDLKVGGEGMKAFYDKMLVDKANAIGKKHGARVETSQIDTKPERGPVPEGSHDFSRQQDVHVLRITPELRAAAMKGFPLFSAGGVVAGGVMGELARQDKYGQNE